MFSFDEVIRELRNERLVFHSEDDLKLSMGLIINRLYPTFRIRLERPVEIDMIDRNGNKSVVRAPIDIVLIDDNDKEIPIELKYKTKKPKKVVNFAAQGELFALANHGAADTGRFSFRKDIYRVEQLLLNSSTSSEGYVFILTNEPVYFDNDISERDNLDKNFSFHQGATIRPNDLSWNYEKLNKEVYHQRENDNCWESKLNSKPHWTCKKGYFYKLDLASSYQIDWGKYSEVDNQKFRFCALKIEV
jgi:hypothetical protein